MKFHFQCSKTQKVYLAHTFSAHVFEDRYISTKLKHNPRSKRQEIKKTEEFRKKQSQVAGVKQVKKAVGTAKLSIQHI